MTTTQTSPTSSLDKATRTLRVWNTLTRRLDPFVPLREGRAGLYTCGPTVYRYVHIGNLRTYLMADWLRRTLQGLGYEVTHVKNITDVGHMRQDQVERGEDKMIAAALAEGKTPAQIAAFYTDAFLQDEQALRILPAHVYPRATEHVPDMVALVERLLSRGHAYEAGGNVYFDVASLPSYGQLSRNTQEGLIEAVRVEADPLKRNPADFTLWKGAEAGRMVKWPSPWGEGFPGWHIECSAMSMRYLGTEFDLHTGGVDNIFPHHEDEIAQSEGATGHRFVRYWLHAQHLLADGVKMAKSEGNAYTLSDLVGHGYSPAAFRYLCATVHYRSRLNFTFRSLRAAEHGLAHLTRLLPALEHSADAPAPLPAGDPVAARYREAFWGALCDDLHLPGALAVLWELARGDEAPARKLALALEFDQVLGFGLADLLTAPAAHVERGIRWTEARAAGDYDSADALLVDMRAAGVHPLLVPDGATRLAPWSPSRGRLAPLSSASDVPSLLNEADSCDVSVSILAHGYSDDVRRCLEGVLRHAGGHRIEILAVDNDADEETRAVLEEYAARDGRVRLFRTDHRFGEAEGRNVALRQSRGRIVLLLDTGVELTGDAYGPLLRMLGDPAIGVTGKWGVRSDDLREFYASDEAEVDAIEGYLFAFRRADLRWLGGLDEHFRFYRNLDIFTCFEFKNRGLRVARIPDLPAAMHEHRGWLEYSPEERDRRSHKNFRRFLDKWHHDEHLLASQGPATAATTRP